MVHSNVLAWLYIVCQSVCNLHMNASFSCCYLVHLESLPSTRKGYYMISDLNIYSDGPILPKIKPPNIFTQCIWTDIFKNSTFRKWDLHQIYRYQCSRILQSSNPLSICLMCQSKMLTFIWNTAIKKKPSAIRTNSHTDWYTLLYTECSPKLASQAAAVAAEPQLINVIALLNISIVGQAWYKIWIVCVCNLYAFNAALTLDCREDVYT